MKKYAAPADCLCSSARRSPFIVFYILLNIVTFGKMPPYAMSRLDIYSNTIVLKDKGISLLTREKAPPPSLLTKSTRDRPLPSPPKHV